MAQLPTTCDFCSGYAPGFFYFLASVLRSGASPLRRREAVDLSLSLIFLSCHCGALSLTGGVVIIDVYSCFGLLLVASAVDGGSRQPSPLRGLAPFFWPPWCSFFFVVMDYDKLMNFSPRFNSTSGRAGARASARRRQRNCNFRSFPASL